MPNAREQRRSKKSRERWRGGVNKTEGEKGDNDRTEEKRQEEVVLIYTLKSPQILHGSTQLSIEGNEAIYSIFYFLILSSLCEPSYSRGLPDSVCVCVCVCVLLCSLYNRVSVHVCFLNFVHIYHYQFL